MAESFFGTLECELLDRYTFRTPTEARQAVFRYIEGWYKPRRSAKTPRPGSVLLRCRQRKLSSPHGGRKKKSD